MANSSNETRRRRDNGHGRVITGNVIPGGAVEIPPEMLAALGFKTKKTLITDDDIQRHDGTAIILPQDMPLERMVAIGNAKIEEQEQEHVFVRRYEYRPPDGANATANVLNRMFGIVVGKVKPPEGFFDGPTPPGYISVQISPTESRDVPWGQISVPALPGATVELSAERGDLGPVFVAKVIAPKKHKATIEELFAAIEEELRINSIYRGHALQGANELTFLPVAGFRSDRIVFADTVEATLEAALWNPIRDPEAVKRSGMSLRRAVLLYGPFGTGKSSAGLMAAQLAEQYQWTFLAANAGKDDLRAVMTTAALYQRAIVFVEDLDTHTPNINDRSAVAELLDVFDGIGVKDREIILIATTNHIETVPAGMLRPGRMDYVVEIAGLDRGGVERLLRAIIPTERLDPNVDFDAVFAETDDFLPAWVKAIGDRAQSFALARVDGSAYRLTTQDLVLAARSLHPQLELMRKATEGTEEPQLDQVMRGMVREAVEDVRVVDGDGDPVGDCGGWRLTGQLDG